MAGTRAKEIVVRVLSPPKASHSNMTTILGGDWMCRLKLDITKHFEFRIFSQSRNLRPSRPAAPPATFSSIGYFVAMARQIGERRQALDGGSRASDVVSLRGGQQGGLQWMAGGAGIFFLCPLLDSSPLMKPTRAQDRQRGDYSWNDVTAME